MMFSPSNPSRRAAVSRAGVSATGIDEGNGTLFHATDRLESSQADLDAACAEVRDFGWVSVLVGDEYVDGLDGSDRGEASAADLGRVRDNDDVAGSVHYCRADLRDQLVRGRQTAVGAEPVAAHHGDGGAEFLERLD